MRAEVMVSLSDHVDFNEARKRVKKEPVSFVEFCQMVSDFKKEFVKEFEAKVINGN